MHGNAQQMAVLVTLKRKVGNFAAGACYTPRRSGTPQPKAMTRVIVAGSMNPACLTLSHDLRQRGEAVWLRDGPVTLGDLEAFRPDIIVSYNSRHLMPRSVFAWPRLGAINLHISFLPWNRGADPNFWSHIEGTPSGVTIHHIDEGLDSGDIIAQERMEFGPEHTLASSYEALHRRIRDLLYRVWPAIVAGTAPRTPQGIGGSFHRIRDRAAYEHLLSEHKWQTTIGALRAHSALCFRRE
jgi:hypothetical protein